MKSALPLGVKSALSVKSAKRVCQQLFTHMHMHIPYRHETATEIGSESDRCCVLRRAHVPWPWHIITHVFTCEAPKGEGPWLLLREVCCPI